MLLHKAVLIIAIVICFSSYIIAKTTVLCYIASWAIDRPGLGNFSVLNADTDHCTHIVYAFIPIDGKKHEIQKIERGHGHDELSILKELKISNPNIQILVSIGGWSDKGKKFSDIARSGSNRNKFIASVIKFIRTYELDGIDICWQFPGHRGGRSDDKEHSVTLFRELKEALKPGGSLLTMHLLGKKYTLDKINVKALSDIVDYINFIPVQFHGPWDGKTGITTALTSLDKYNVKYVVEYILKKEVDPGKLLLGLATYGHAYLLEERPEGKYIGIPTNKTFSSPWTRESGIIAYNEVCYAMTNSEGWNEVWDEDSQTPIVYNDKKLISYDNEKSLLLKAKFAKQKNLAGLMIWSLDMDDFRGECYGKKYPILSAVFEYINKSNLELPDSKTEQPHRSDSNSTAEIVTVVYDLMDKVGKLNKL